LVFSAVAAVSAVSAVSALIVIASAPLLAQTAASSTTRAHVEALGLEHRVRLALEEDHIGVWPDRDGEEPA